MACSRFFGDFLGALASLCPQLLATMPYFGGADGSVPRTKMLCQKQIQ